MTQDTGDPQFLQRYLERFPTGAHRGEAQERLDRVRKKQREDDRKTELRAEIPKALEAQQWDQAGKGIHELLNLESEDRQALAWRQQVEQALTAQLARARRERRVRELEEKMPQSMTERDWAATDRVLAEIWSLDENRAGIWHRMREDARDAERARERLVMETNEKQRREQPAAEMKRLGFEFVPIAAGEFIPGRPARSGRKVPILRPFEMGRFEVTQQQWEAIMGRNPSLFQGPALPVENVSRLEIQDFLQRLNQRQDGYRYRLPTAAEWEYAARAGIDRFFSEQEVNEQAWYGKNSERRTHEVGRKARNAWGLHDMLGNVWEWCEEELRGGDFNDLDADTILGHVFFNGPKPDQDQRNGSWGFRCVREPVNNH